MRTSMIGLCAMLVFVAAPPAFAQDEDPSAIQISGSAGLVSDYRFRGFSQNNEDVAVQGGITAAHDSGVYAGTWGSSVGFAGHTEVDLFAGYSREIAPGVTADVGLLYYLYPKHGGGDTDFFEPYATLSGTIGPATLKVGVNYAWKQSALRDAAGGKASALYLHAEPAIAIPGTPFELNAHLGYAKSDAFPGGPDGRVFDYSLGASAAYKMLTFGVAYVNTDVKQRLGKEALGADGAVVFSLTASF